jgi:hypothetical protein
VDGPLLHITLRTTAVTLIVRPDFSVVRVFIECTDYRAGNVQSGMAATAMYSAPHWSGRDVIALAAVGSPPSVCVFWRQVPGTSDPSLLGGLCDLIHCG